MYSKRKRFAIDAVGYSIGVNKTSGEAHLLQNIMKTFNNSDFNYKYDIIRRNYYEYTPPNIIAELKTIYNTRSQPAKRRTEIAMWKAGERINIFTNEPITPPQTRTNKRIIY